MRLLPICALALAVGDTIAQTYVVDVNNGPGTNYTSIAAAVAAVPDGAVLIVRPGTYAGFTISGKGLTILGSGVNLTAPFVVAITIDNTGPAQPVTLRGLTTTESLLSATNCAGALHVEQCSGGMQYVPYATVSLTICSQVLLRGVTGQSSITAWNSDLVLESCSFAGSDMLGMPLTLPTPALDLHGGSATIASCTLIGGDGGFSFSASPPLQPDRGGIALANASAIVAGPSVIRSGSSPIAPGSAITGSGVLNLDPAATVTASGTPTIEPGVATTVAPLPWITGTSATVGGSLGAHVAGPAGQLSILVLGFPGPALHVPGVAGAFWLAPQPYAFAAIGNAPFAGSAAVPNNPGLRGVTLAWQSAALTGGAFTVSNPTWTLVY